MDEPDHPPEKGWESDTDLSWQTEFLGNADTSLCC